MIRYILIKFWPAFIPIALYLLWYANQKRKVRHTDIIVTITDGPWFITIIATMMLIIASFLWAGLVDSKTGPAEYYPAILHNGEIIEGEIE